MQLAIREKSHRMTNILMHDARNWFHFCQEDFAKMEPSVKIQMEASMHILNGVRRVLVTKNKEVKRTGRGDIEHGQKYLEKYPEGPAFGQLRQLAHNVLEHTNDKQVMFKKALKSTALAQKRVQDQIRDDRIMKASQLRRAGLHSPVSPSQWNTGNLDEDIPIGRNDQKN